MKYLNFWVCALLAAACATSQQWQTTAHPSEKEAAAILLQTDPTRLDHDLVASEVPEIPMPANQRPCCTLGDNARVRVGPIPVFFFRLSNTRGPEDLGEHAYGSGFIRTHRSGRSELSFDPENNGLVYTCRGGFIDTAHAREWADWTLFLSAAYARNFVNGLTIDLPSETASIRVELAPIDPAIVEEIGLRRLAVSLAQWTAFQLSMWHEVATWFGDHSVPGWSEEASAFSPEDMISNLIGIRMAGGIVFHRGGAESEASYNEAVNRWFQSTLVYLGVVSRRLAHQATAAVDGLWWDSLVRLPDKRFILRRNFQVNTQVAWLVPSRRLRDPRFADLRAACGDAAEPIRLVVPGSIDGYRFEDWLTVKIGLDEDMAARTPFPEFGANLTQGNLPRVVAAIELLNEVEFGQGADRPDFVTDVP